VEGHVLQNLAVLALVALGLVVGRALRNDRLWRESLGKVWRRQPVAICVLAFFVAVALLDSISWVGGELKGEDVLAQHEARSVIDRAFTGVGEASYAAPRAEVLFEDPLQKLNDPGGHLLGTDIIGRDVLHRVLKGARVALLIGGVTSLIAIPLALLLGVSAGYFGGKLDDAVFFVMSTLSSIPSLLLLIAIVMALGRGTLQVCIALGVTSWVSLCRVSRGETLKLRELDYVQAARALGVSELRIVFRHIVPNLMHLIVISFVLLFSGQVIAETVLSYLGIGVDGSWGQMIDQGRNELSREPMIWWNIAAAGVAVFSLLLSVNFIGDALRDVLDPRTARERE
jgi:peptide/nickel transport system permease protein